MISVFKLTVKQAARITHVTAGIELNFLILVDVVYESLNSDCMADNGSVQSSGVWPMAKFYFKVIWGSTEITFQEVSGLDAETQVIEYRRDNSPVFSTVKMPGIAKNGNISMKKGVFKSDNSYLDWYNQVKANTIKRMPVTISLLDESGSPTMTWKLLNAWPTKISATDMKSDGNEIAVESIEIAHEGITIE